MEWTKELLRTVSYKTELWTPSKDKRDSFHYIDVSSVSNNTFTIKETSLVKADAAPGRARKIVKWQDTIFATIRPSLKRVAFIPQEYDNQIASTAFCVVRPKQNQVVPLYVYFFLLSDSLNAEVNGLQHGASYPAITDKDVLNQTIPLPPLLEQQKIAAVLFKIQQAIEIQASIVEKTWELKKSTLHHVFTYGLRGEKLKETEIGPMPESWDVRELDSVLKLAQYGLSVRGLSTGQYPILRMNCQIDGQVHFNDLQYVNLDDDIFEKFKMDDGDILFNRTNSWELVGRTAIYHLKDAAVFASYLIRLKFDEEKINPDYLNYFFNMEATQKRLKALASRGVSQSNISASKLKTFQVPVPVTDEQLEIVKILRALDQKIMIHTAQKSALQDLFKTMLNKLMTGEIRVKDLDIATAEVAT